jgi:hypothetical protein
MQAGLGEQLAGRGQDPLAVALGIFAKGLLGSAISARAKMPSIFAKGLLGAISAWAKMPSICAQRAIGGLGGAHPNERSKNGDTSSIFVLRCRQDRRTLLHFLFTATPLPTS